MRKRPCLLFACIFLTGIVFQRYDWKCLWCLPACFLVEEIYYGLIFCKGKYKRVAGRSLVLLSAFFLGISHMRSEEDFRNTYMSKLEDSSDAVIFGEILTIQETEYGGRLILTDCYVSLKETIVPCNKVMVYVSSDQYRIGQTYQIKGQIHLFEHPRNEGNFDSVLFYQSQKIDFSIYASESILLGCEENALRNAILSLKQCLTKVYQSCIKEAAAGFYVGMLLGDKSLLLDRTKELFAVGGISHVLAVSGLHMSMLGRGLYRFLRKRRIGFLMAGILAGVFLLAYCFMAGNGISAIRAVGMMLLFFTAQYFGRSYDMLNSLGVMMIYLLWENPFLIEYSGFQFSVAALIGVGFIGQALSEDFLKRENKNTANNTSSMIQDEKLKSSRNPMLNHMSKTRTKLRASLWMSIGITLTTLPITACCYFEVPLYSPLVNSLVLPLLSPIFVLAVFGGLIGCVFPALGRVILVPCEWLYMFYEFVCEFVEGLPLGTLIVGKPKMEVIVLYYAVLFIGCLFVKKWNDTIQKGGTLKQCECTSFHMNLWKVFLVVICFLIILYPKPVQSEIIFLDVGQGDGIYIGSEDGTTCFIDGGSSDVNAVGTYRILPFLKAHGVRRIDYWFVSHADADHVSGLLEVMEAGYEIGHLVISDKMPEDENREKLISLAEKQEIRILPMKAGDAIQTMMPAKNTMFLKAGIRITCLYPWSDNTDRNEQSLVLLLEFLDQNGVCTYKACFSGDISANGEKELIRKDVLTDVDLYKAAHHGSKYSNSKEFLGVIQPEVCVISCGKDNSYGHPHVEVVENIKNIGAEIIYTMECGQVTIRNVNGIIELNEFRE